MAKSKSGGTRAYIRGRVGSDVYSVGKTAKGKKQQVVRSLAETVANPQTESQMRGRMIMSTIMQTVSALSPIIDHSFDGLPKGQPNISEFISRNYSLIKADVAAHPASGNEFGLNKYQEKLTKGGAYVISAGSVPNPTAMAVTLAKGGAVVTLTADTMTVGGLKAALGINNGDFITVVGCGVDQPLVYVRFYLKSGISDSTSITSENIETLFDVETNGQAALVARDATHTIEIGSLDTMNSVGVILSVKTANGWEHNDATMAVTAGIPFTADEALPTYPVGGADFLNGGDIF